MGLEVIEELKKKLNLTSRELSEKSGVPKGTLDKILNGTTKDPKLETLKALSRVLNCTLDDFDDKDAKSLISIKEKRLVDNFNKLNEIGKDEAIKRVSELTEISKYIEDKSYLMPIAAHLKEGADLDIAKTEVEVAIKIAKELNKKDK